MNPKNQSLATSIRRCSKTVSHISSVFLLIALCCGVSPASVQAADLNLGAIEGRVFNAGNGRALENARVSVEPAGPSTATDAVGYFRLNGVPIGSTRITVSYLGLRQHAENVQVVPGSTATVTVELTRSDGKENLSVEELVKLSAFTVTAERQMSAQALALNEQRAASNTKKVVSLDEFGNQGDENIGDFMQFLPGLSVNVSSDGPTSASLRGFPTNYTNISIDGGTLATARGNTRSISLPDVPFLSGSRIEVTKVPTPDMPASGLGGSINIVPKNGFELKRRAFNYRLTANTESSNGLRAKWPKAPQSDTSPDYTIPAVALSFQGQISERIAITASFANSWRMKPGEDNHHTDDFLPTWDRVRNIQTSGAWQALPDLTRSKGGQLGFDFRLTPNDILSVGGQIKFHYFDVSRSQILVNYGAGASGGATFTQGAATGVGSIAMNAGGGWYSRFNRQRQLNLKYRHRGETWNLNLNADYSDARYRELTGENGYFATITAQIPNLVIRGDNILFGGIATSYNVKDRAGNSVDMYNGANYPITSATDRFINSNAKLPSVRADLSKIFKGRVPLQLKIGVAGDVQERDRVAPSSTYSFTPNGASDSTSRLAGNFDVFDENYLSSKPTMFGVPIRDISQQKVYDLFRKNPSWFVLNRASAWQSLVNSSISYREAISAEYLRADTRLFSDRLGIVAGVRFEQTSISGLGPLNDINAIYQRNANGSFVLDGNRNKVLLTTDALQQSLLQYKLRAAAAKSDYSGYYPSINTNYRLGDKFVARLAYARTIGRPDVSLLIPGTTITAADAIIPTITVNNPQLLPWTANNYDLSLESYEIAGGSGSVGFFAKDVHNFFSQVSTPATNALLTQYGLPTDGTYDNYTIATRTNIGDAKITGAEFSYRQQLKFMPGLFKDLHLMANYTKMHRAGARTADFSGFVPSNFTGGLYFIRPRYFIKINYVHQDSFRTTSVAASATELPNTFGQVPVYTRWNANGEYSISKSYALFASTTDFRSFITGTQQYAPETPTYARWTRYQKVGYVITFGIKGAF